jgi:ribosome biogenesis GTPase A
LLTVYEDGAFPDDAVDPENNFLGSPGQLTQVCDRCHDLIHHNKAVSSPKPTILAIRNYLEESPYKNNRVYHIIDAADFPMSLVPRIHWALMLQEQRSRNRRSTNEKYQRGRKLPTLSFIITRSDLLAATKEQVDSKMDYIRTELRAALGRSGREARLGNVHMISAHRGWWTKEVKEEIRDHGGGIWVVGKANVGKSSFIEACFPKDSKNLAKVEEWMERRRDESEIPNQREAALLNPDSLLPPAPREDLYPVLPVVSSLPGTTVSPIRIPFGRGRGEVIDLPGLERGLLEDFVKDEHKRDLIMTKRVKPERCTIKPGQSLLVGGGLVRITPVNPEDTVMSASFLSLETHITNTQKAHETQTEEQPYRGTVIMKEGTGSTIASAGKFDLKWDTTISNLPTSLAKAVRDKGIPVPTLPYKVMSADILIEGCGWIELSIQIRSKRGTEDEPFYPQVEVFTPNGKHVGCRRPIECWNFIAEKKKIDKRNRPRLRH